MNFTVGQIYYKIIGLNSTTDLYLALKICSINFSDMHSIVALI